MLPHAYLDEHGQVIRTDIVNMARDLDAAADSVGGDPTQVQRSSSWRRPACAICPSAYVIDARRQRRWSTALEDAKLPYMAPSAQAIAASRRRARCRC